MMEDAKTLTKNDPEKAVYKVRGPPGGKKIVRLATKVEVAPRMVQGQGGEEKEGTKDQK